MKQLVTRVRGPVLILQNPIKDFKQGRDGVGFVFKKDHCGGSTKNELEERRQKKKLC